MSTSILRPIPKSLDKDDEQMCTTSDDTRALDGITNNSPLKGYKKQNGPNF